MNVSLFTSENCPNCASVKEFLNNKGIQYEIINISADKSKKRELMANGFLSVPVLLVDGDYFLAIDDNKMKKYFE